jgi:plastocyanin
MVLQQTTAPTPFHNAVPVIDALVASADAVGPGKTVTLSVAAHDADPGDSLTYAWTATGGSFAGAATAASTWTAPAAEGSYQLTVTVTDTKGGALSVSLAVTVGAK